MDKDTIQLVIEWLLAGGGLLALLRFFRDRKKDGYASESIRLSNDEKRVQAAYEGEKIAIAEKDRLRAQLRQEEIDHVEDNRKAQETEEKLLEQIVDLKMKIRKQGGTP